MAGEGRRIGGGGHVSRMVVVECNARFHAVLVVVIVVEANCRLGFVSRVGQAFGATSAPGQTRVKRVGVFIMLATVSKLRVTLPDGDMCRLARPLERAAEHLTGVDRKGEPIHRRERAEATGEGFNFQNESLMITRKVYRLDGEK